MRKGAKPLFSLVARAYKNEKRALAPFLGKDKPYELVKDVHGLFLAGLDITEYTLGVMKLEPGDPCTRWWRARGLAGDKVLESIREDSTVFAEEAPQFDDIAMVVLTINE